MTAVDPELAAPLALSALRRDDRAHPRRVRPRRGHPRVAALDRPRLLPAAAVRAREDRLHRLHRRLPRRPFAPDHAGLGRARGRRDSRRARSCSCSSSPTSARLSSTAPRSSGLLFFAGVRWLHLALLGIVAAAAAVAVLWFLPHRGDRGAEAVPDGSPDRLHQSGLRPERNHLQRQPVDHRGRRGRSRRARRRGRHPDESQLPPRARDRLHLRLARRAARLPRRVDPAAPLRPRHLARDQGDRRREQPLLGHRRRARSSRCSSSRCS